MPRRRRFRSLRGGVLAFGRMCNLYTRKMTAEEMRALKLHFQFIGTTWTEWEERQPSERADRGCLSQPVRAGRCLARRRARRARGHSAEDSLAMQKPAPDDALVVGPLVKPEKKAA